MMSQKDPVAAAARKYKPIQSAVPGTTLGPIQIDAFLGGVISNSPSTIAYLFDVLIHLCKGCQRRPC